MVLLRCLSMCKSLIPAFTWSLGPLAMRPDMIDDAKEMLSTADPAWVVDLSAEAVPGMTIHEMGAARMGKDPKTSVFKQIQPMS
jgi:hypothetical protein